MRIAVVGGGVSGIVAAHQLHREHDVTLFEADPRLGGHSNTVTVETQSGVWNIDTGFIVLNDRTYPNFNRLLAEAGVAIQSTHMGFSVSGIDEDFEYAGTPRGVFCQRSNLIDRDYWRMLRDLVRFNRSLRDLLAQPGDDEPTLREWLELGGYSRMFIERLIGAQISAVWSADVVQVWDFPVRLLAQFFENHGMLGFRDRPRWSTVVGGSRSYVEALSAPFADRVRLGTPVRSVARTGSAVELRVAGAVEEFDEVVLACHSDQALALLEDPSEEERQILGALPYQDNEAVLHTDGSLLPRRRAARQAWNYHLFRESRPRTTVTYYMNHLQRLRAPEEFCVTLNLTDRIDPSRVIRTFNYAHPVFTPEGIAAQRRWSEISGVRHTHYCGAYWRYGFHEDGVFSALRACEGVGVERIVRI